MNRYVLCVGLIIFHALLAGQEKSVLEGAEVFLSVNRTTFFDDNTENRSGFGAGVNFQFTPERRFTFFTGIEYNQTGQYKYELFEGRWCSSSDWEIKMYLFSIPVGFRYSFGSKKRILVESSVFVDVPFKSYREGEKCCYAPDPDNPANMTGGCNQVTVKGDIGPGFGLSFGVGYRIPFSKADLIIKPDYKFDLNKIYDYSDAIYNRYIRLNIIFRINQRSRPSSPIGEPGSFS